MSRRHDPQSLLRQPCCTSTHSMASLAKETYERRVLLHVYLMLTLVIYSGRHVPVASAQGVIDNEVVGMPEIQCNDQGITFSVRTRNPFRGNVYVRGQFGIPRCRKEFYDNDSPYAGIGIHMGDCGMLKTRQLQPMGMNYALVIMVNFHPRFITKVDRAYDLHCFYAQADRPVATELQVGEPPQVAVASDGIMLPNCWYSLRRETFDGPVVTAVQIGEPIVHRWECNNPDYGMLVKNCEVADGGSQHVLVIDAAGCPTETPVIGNAPTYDDSLSLAFVPTFAYAFPDRAIVHFQCQIQICSKREGECLGLTPPKCPQVQGGYTPNSYVNPNVSPTEVVGTYRQPFPIPPNPTPMGPMEQRSPVPLPPAFDPSGMTAPPLLPRPISAARRLRPLDGASASPDLLILSTRPRTNESMRHAASFFRSIVPASVTPPAASLTAERERIARMRRAEGETMDVVANTIQILTNSGLDLNSPHQRAQKGSSRLLERPYNINSLSRSYCIDRRGFITLIVGLVFTVILCLALSAYLLYDIARKRRKSRFGLISSRRGSNQSVNAWSRSGSRLLTRLIEWIREKRARPPAVRTPSQPRFDHPNLMRATPFQCQRQQPANGVD